jgi:hypothetical protein
MKRILRVPVVAVALALAGATFLFSSTAAAQSTLFGRPALLKVNWFGPFGLSPNDTVRFVYTNLGLDNVQIEWAFTNAETGELVCGNFGKPASVMAGKGAIWDYSQTLSVDPATGEVTETRICDNNRVVTDEVYFDSKLRHELVAWIFILHQDARGMKNAVDLPAVQLFNSMMLDPTMCPAAPGAYAPPCRSMTFGRTLAVIQANPTAPTEFPKALLPQQ